MYPQSFFISGCSFFHLVLRFKLFVALFFILGGVGIFKVFGMAADPRVTAHTLGMNPYSMDPLFYAQGQPYWMPDYVMAQWMMHQNQGFYGHNPANFWLHNFSSAGSCNKCSKKSRTRRNRFTYYVPGQDRDGQIQEVNVADINSPSADNIPAATIPPDTVTEEALAEAPPPVEVPAPQLVENEQTPEEPKLEADEPSPKPQEEKPEESIPELKCPVDGQTVRPGLVACGSDTKTRCRCPGGQVLKDGACVARCNKSQLFDPNTCKCTNKPQETPKDFCSPASEPDASSASGVTCVHCSKEKIKNLFNDSSSPVSLKELEKFLTDVNTASGLFKEDDATQNRFQTFKDNFCGKSCGQADMGSFVNYVKQRSRAEGVPFEVLLGLMLKESGGRCDTGPGSGCNDHNPLMCNGPGWGMRNPTLRQQIRTYNQTCRAKPNSPIDGSFGLFQLNLTHPNVCEYKVRRKCNISQLTDAQLQKACQSYSEKPACILTKNPRNDSYNNDSHCQIETDSKQAQEKGVCLNNPYCSFEEALDLLKRKWRMEHVKRKDPFPSSGKKSFKELIPGERDGWRRVIMAYNSSTLLEGSYEFHKLPVAQNMREAVGMPALEGWELERMFLLNAAIYSPGNGSEADKKRQVIQESANGTRYRFPNRTQGLDMLAHLSYMEQIAGREVAGAGKNSFICQWEDFEKTNGNNLPCPSSQ